jgi:hypothetical protein
VPRGVNHLYILVLTIDEPVCLAARADESSWKWYARFGHLNFPALQKLYTVDMVPGLPSISEANRLCDSCIISMQCRVPFPSKSSVHADEALELMHSDLCGPINPSTSGGKTMFLLMVDDMCRYMWLILLSAKSDAARMIKQVQAQAKAECGKKLKVLRMAGVVSSPHPGSSTTATTPACGDISRRPTPHNRMGLWNAGIKPSLVQQDQC